MSRLDIHTPSHAQTVVDRLYKAAEQRIEASPPGLCPVDIALSFLNLSHAQTCGKCVPCRIGLGQLSNLLEDVLDGKAEEESIALIEDTAQTVVDSADCAIGISAAKMVLDGVKGFREDYLEHIRNHRCLGSLSQPVPCVALCPARVDIPGYISLINEGRLTDAVKLIRKDNPFPTACAYICEHPCEARCRRSMVDNPVNIRGLKRYAVDNAEKYEAPRAAGKTGKHVAVIGGGPSGLSAAYFLSIMGHEVTVYEKRKQLGGMLRYGIPSYRLPREKLEEEIGFILSTGIKVKTGIEIGQDITVEELRSQCDSVYIAIGAHTDKKTGIQGEDAHGVISAVELLRGIGDDDYPDYTGKNVVVIGGGNVAMDVSRSAIRLGASKVSCVYRRRQADMTALVAEVEGALAEGVELCTLQAPLRIEVDSEGNACALWTQPQIIGEFDDNYRPRPKKAVSAPEVRIPADVIIVAVGQGIETRGFQDQGVPITHGTFDAMSNSHVGNMVGVFAGGDCVTGPATVIQAIAAGKVAAANIDDYLGFQHMISADVDVPDPKLYSIPPHGRINITEREAGERKNDFECVECGMSAEGVAAESSRCLRCDHFGYGIFRGGRLERW